MKEILAHLFQYKTLTRQEAGEVLRKIASGQYNDTQIAVFLGVFLMRSITIEELSGFREILKELALKIDLGTIRTIDLCGTGGDGKNTFNISTLSAFVLAGAGEKVVKHGNYGVSSACGSSNILEHFGYRFSNDQDKLVKELAETGICFLHAPLFNPAMKNVAPVRRALKIKTFFNMLGPMVNPAFPKKQLVGVYILELARLYNYLYQQSAVQYAIVHSLDGYDEVSLTSDFKFILNGVEQIISAESLGYERTVPADLAGGSTVQEAAGIFISVLQGKGTRAQNQVVLANTELALRCYYPQKSAGECKEAASASLLGGKAYERFTSLIDMQS